MEKILAGTYTIQEYRAIVKRWRDRYAVNKLAVYCDPLKIRYLDNLKVTVKATTVVLEEIDEQGFEPVSRDGTTSGDIPQTSQ